ncbi:MAG: hypothetical protein ACKVOQ_21750 [Cyclobacteriaceae bacterium]
MRRFTSTDAFTTSGALSSSVSELLSNQLSYWLTQVDQNLEIDFDLGNFDQESFNRQTIFESSKDEFLTKSEYE